MIHDLMAMTITPIARQVLTCSAYEMQNIVDTCFLKCADSERVMKSEAVSEHAPQAINRDWRL